MTPNKPSWEHHKQAINILGTQATVGTQVPQTKRPGGRTQTNNNTNNQTFGQQLGMLQPVRQTTTLTTRPKTVVLTQTPAVIWELTNWTTVTSLQALHLVPTCSLPFGPIPTQRPDGEDSLESQYEGFEDSSADPDS